MDFAKIAINNISRYGDTDIFPFPMENALFFDKAKEVENLIEDMENNFDTWMADDPVESIKTCVPVGYTGYRWATFIEPLWNCFLLYQVLKISEKLEMNRISVEKKCVFSYRLKIDEKSNKIFDSDQNWRAFCSRAVQIAETEKYHYVVRFDISDFYNRVYHHRLENALIRCEIDNQVKSRIMKILQALSDNASYGLPVGGNAARILAEMLLDPLDKMLDAKGYVFCRYVDDYILFAESREDAFRKLNYCADFLLRNEGLGLQKSKTQVLTVSEFVSQTKNIMEDDGDKDSKVRSEFLKLHIHFDPYSATAEEDYAALKENIKNFDILSLLKNEVRKSRIHHALGKQILHAVNILEGEKLDLAFSVIGANIENLYPIFPSVMQVAHKKIEEISSNVQKEFIGILFKLVENDSYILQTENNAAYAIRVFAKVNNEMSVKAIEKLYSRGTSTPLVKSNCIYAMINLGNGYWLSDKRTRFPSFSGWERRAFIASSYFLNDEGKHWREHIKRQFSPFEMLVKEWVSSKNPVQNKWRIPI
ncbi:RNA-directed DNA polymerase [Candidatus Saccharibacteria bacterium]|nr:RNA-directed DNA polymerase [Candidatus Saccharibacteria bacterium]